MQDSPFSEDLAAMFIVIKVTPGMLAQDIQPSRLQRGGAEVHILALAAGPEIIPPPGSPPAPVLDMDTLGKAARAMGGTVTAVTADKSDIENLSTKIERSISRAPAQDGQQWQDAGYWLLAPLMLLMLTFFRRGGAAAIE
jgi:Ca-activated chloride channel family protein